MDVKLNIMNHHLSLAERRRPSWRVPERESVGVEVGLATVWIHRDGSIEASACIGAGIGIQDHGPP